MHKEKWNKIPTILLTILITTCSLIAIETTLYFSLRKNLTLVFYQIEYVEEEIATNYKEEYTIAYIRLNSKKNHKLNVDDFSIFSNAKWEKAVKVEYFNQSIRTTFDTYPNQPILKVFFRTTQSEVEPVVFIKYKDTEMRIGEFATLR